MRSVKANVLTPTQLQDYNLRIPDSGCGEEMSSCIWCDYRRKVELIAVFSGQGPARVNVRCVDMDCLEQRTRAEYALTYVPMSRAVLFIHKMGFAALVQRDAETGTHP